MRRFETMASIPLSFLFALEPALVQSAVPWLLQEAPFALAIRRTDSLCTGRDTSCQLFFDFCGLSGNDRCRSQLRHMAKFTRHVSGSTSCPDRKRACRSLTDCRPGFEKFAAPRSAGRLCLQGAAYGWYPGSCPHRKSPRTSELIQ